MDHDVQVDELLSAYITGDVTPAERAAVEARLAGDPAFRQQFSELSTLHGLLKQAQRPVSARMLAELQRRMTQSAPDVASLLSASISNDVDQNERAKLDAYLAQHPAAHKELASLSALSAFLKQGERAVPAHAKRSLAERLSAKIPAAALAPMLPNANETVAMQLRTSAPTVRIYAMQESPWRRRILRTAVAVAAAVALSVGTIFGLRAWKSSDDVAKLKPVKSPGNDVSIKDAARDVEPAPQPQPEITPPPPVNRAPEPPSNLTPSVPIGQATPVPAPAPVAATAPSATEVPETRNTNTPRPPRTPATQPQVEPAAPAVQPVEPAHSPDVPPALDPDEKTVVEKNKPQGGVPYIQSGNILNSPGATTVAQGPTNVVPSPSPTATAPTAPTAPVTPNTPDPAPPPPPDNSFIAALDGKMVVAVLRDGTDAQATVAAGLRTLQLKDELPSDTSITTGSTRVAFVLPGDGRLWVNRHSSISVQLRGVNTIVNIDSGEVSYRAPNGGNVTVNHPSGVQADTNGLMDVSVDDASKTLTASAITAVARVGRKGKTLRSVPAKNKAIEKLDSSTDPALAAGPDTVLLWQQDLRVNGEGANGLPIATTSKKEGRKVK